MNVPRWLKPSTNPALYTALASVALSVWQAVQVDFWAGSLTVAEVGRVAAPIVIAYLSYGFQRRKTTPVADPRDSNGAPLASPGLIGLGDAERRRAENLRLTHAPGTPSFYPYPGENVATGVVDPAPIGRGGYRGGKPASEMPPPPTDVPSVSKLPDGGGGGAP